MSGMFAGRRVVRLVTMVATVTVLLPLLPAYAADGIRTTRAVELAPSAGAGMLAWTQAPRSRPARFAAFLSRGGSTVRLNARGTKGFTAGGAIDDTGARVAYWQHARGNGNIKLYSLATGRRSAPAFVNTPRHEWGASLSGQWLLFARGRFGGRMQVFLANRHTKSVRRLARVASGGYLQPGDVTGRWATWTRCSDFTDCRVVRYNLRNGNRVVLGNPLGRSQFASSVLGNGTIVYAESGNIATCGTRLGVYRKPVAGERRRIQTLPSGTSISTTSVRRLSSGQLAVYYDEQRCDSHRANIYRIVTAG